MSTPQGRPRVLSVGAYERDNFGDLLFLLVTERYLEGCDVVPSAPFAADMTALLDRQIHAIGDELVENPHDVIWSVGGHIGGVSTGGAYKMSKTDAEWQRFLSASTAERREILLAAMHGAPIVSPYLPTPGAYDLNAGAVTVVNSAGLADLRRVRRTTPHVAEEVLDTLRTTDVVSVRDRESSAMLDELGIAHTLSPDVVHTIGLLEPHEPPADSDVAVVQVYPLTLRRQGHGPFARLLARNEHLRGLRFRLVAAGLAEGHDRLEDLEQVADELRKAGREAEVRTERRPLDIVEQIRDSRIVIGTSLHVRIVAAAYARPRVSLRRPKVAFYSAQWDPEMPFDVRYKGFDDAVAQAFALGELAETRKASEELTRRADQNIRATVERMRELVARAHEPERMKLAELRRERFRDVFTRRMECDVSHDELHDTVRQLRHDLREAEAEVERLKEAAASPRGRLRRR